MVGDPVKKVPAEEVKVEPAKPESTVDEKAAENAALDGSITKRTSRRLPRISKSASRLQNAIADAVVKEATVNGSSVEDTSAKEIAAKALTEAEDINVAPDDTVRIVTQPKLVVAPLSAENVEGAGKSLTFDIKLVYDVKATIADKNENMVTEGAGKNTVVLEENKPLKSEVAMDITLDDVSAIAIPEGDKGIRAGSPREGCQRGRRSLLTIPRPKRPTALCRRSPSPIPTASACLPCWLMTAWLRSA